MTTRPAPRSARCPLILAAWLAGLAGLSPHVALAADHTLRDVRFDFGSILISIPQLEVQGTDLTAQQLSEILRPDGSEPIHERFSRLQAKAILAPKLDVAQKFGKFSGLTAHVDVRFGDVTNGRAATASIGSAKTSGTLPDGKAFTGEQGSTQIEGLDLRALADAMTQTRPAGSPPAPQVIATAVRTDWSRSWQDGSSETKTGAQSARDVTLSRGTTAQVARWAQLMTLIEGLLADDPAGKANEVPPQLKDAETLLRLIGLMDDVGVAQADVNDIEINTPARGKDVPAVRLAIRQMAVTMTGFGKPSRFELSDLNGSADQARFAVKSIGFSGFTPQEGYEALARKARPLVESGQFGDLLALAPVVGSVTLGGLVIEAPKADKAPKAREFAPLEKVTLDGFELTTRAQKNGIPSDILLALSGLTIPVDGGRDGLKDLAALGYKEATFSSALDAGWNAQTREIVLRRIEAAMKDGFSKTLSGTIGQATEELFSLDNNIRQMAAISLTLKSLEAKFANLGLLDRYAKSVADQQKKTPDAIWREWSTMAALGIPALLGDSDQAKAIASAAGRFLARPRNLAISATAKPRDGVGLADFMAAGGDAKALLPKFDIKAAAE